MSEPEATRQLPGVMERFSTLVLAWTGRTSAFILALGLIVVWLLLGPVFRFSDSWQLVINTTTTIVTFLMVFLIQRAQNKDAKATALKLNELIAAMEGASNRLIDLEDLSESDLEVLHEHYRRLVEMAKRDTSITKSHSIDEAAARHRSKLKSSSQSA
jgi:low affinity Fe/Cu permease